MKTALIVGASGLIGQSLLRYLIDCKNYTKVIALVRRPLEQEHPKLEQQIIDFDKIDSYETSDKIDDVFCCLGTTIKTAGSKSEFTKVDYTYVTNLALWAKANKCRLFSVVSSVGANSKSSNFYLYTKGKMETEISSINLDSVHIFRPSLLLGNREEFRFGERISELLMKVLNPVLIGQLSKYKAIKAKEVAFVMCKKAQSDETGLQIFESNQIR